MQAIYDILFNKSIVNGKYANKCLRMYSHECFDISSFTATIYIVFARTVSSLEPSRATVVHVGRYYSLKSNV